jgi:hypothetical protein
MTYSSTSGVSNAGTDGFRRHRTGRFPRARLLRYRFSNLSKKFFIKEKYAFEVGGQFYNVLNHPNFGLPTASITSGSV